GKNQDVDLNNMSFKEQCALEITEKRKKYASLLLANTTMSKKFGIVYSRAINDLEKNQCESTFFIEAIKTDESTEHVLITFSPFFFNKPNNWCIKVNRDEEDESYKSVRLARMQALYIL